MPLDYQSSRYVHPIVNIALFMHGRIFSIFYIIISVITMAFTISKISSVLIEIDAEKKFISMLGKELDIESILAMDQDGDGVDRVEFLTAMLVQMKGLDKEKDIDPWLKVRSHFHIHLMLIIFYVAI